MSPCSTPATMLSLHPVSGFFGEVVGEKYLLHLPSVDGDKCLGEVDE